MPQNPNPQYYKREKMSANKWTFSFNSIAEYDKFIEDTTKTATSVAKRTLDGYLSGKLINENIRFGGNKWYGTTNPQEIKGNLDTFLYRAEIQNVLSNITNRVNNINLVDIDQQKSIKFTQQEIGIFSFDLAALGLIKVYEYFSPLLNKIVSGNLVESFKTQNEQTIYYFVGQPFVPQHEVEYNMKTNGYFSRILKRNIPKEDLLFVDDGGRLFYEFQEQKEIPRHEVERKHQLNSDGSKKYATTFKKCFVYIPKVVKPLPRVDIIIPFSFSANDNAETLKFNAVPAIALSEALSRIGVNYRIVAAYPIVQKGRLKIFQYINVKKEDEALDKNKIALFTGDPRYYRYQRFRGIVSALSDVDSDSTADDGEWSTIKDNDEIKQNYVDFLAKSTNPEEIAASKRLDSKIVQRPVSTEAGAIQEYERIIKIIKSL